MTKFYRGPETLIWLAAIIYGSTVAAIIYTPIINHHLLLTNKLLFDFIVPACIVAPFGTAWAIYQCFRRETHPWRYVAAVVFIPLGFVWYYCERYHAPKE